MEVQKIAEILIYYIHAPLGGIALLSGGIALVAIKGKSLHKKSGKIFFYSMLISAITAFVISVLPKHESPFLFSIGLFSTYFLVSGLRSLNYKKKEFQLGLDKMIAYIISLISIAMIIYPIVLYGNFNIILAVFGLIGIVFGIRDIMFFRDAKQLKKRWLKLHLGKMMGGYIAAVSAFFVVNHILPGVWNWFVPGIIGSIYISFWMKKLKKKKAESLNQ